MFDSGLQSVCPLHLHLIGESLSLLSVAQYVPQFFVADGIRPLDLEDLSQAGVHECLYFFV